MFGCCDRRIESRCGHGFCVLCRQRLRHELGSRATEEVEEEEEEEEEEEDLQLIPEVTNISNSRNVV